MKFDKYWLIWLILLCIFSCKPKPLFISAFHKQQVIFSETYQGASCLFLACEDFHWDCVTHIDVYYILPISQPPPDRCPVHLNQASWGGGWLSSSVNPRWSWFFSEKLLPNYKLICQASLTWYILFLGIKIYSTYIIFFGKKASNVVTWQGKKPKAMLSIGLEQTETRTYTHIQLHMYYMCIICIMFVWCIFLWNSSFATKCFHVLIVW